RSSDLTSRSTSSTGSSTPGSESHEVPVSVQPLPLRFRLGLRRRPGTLGSAWRQPLAIVGMVLAGAWIIVAIFAPLIAPYDPLAQTSQLTLGPGPAHLFGTDELGRDVFSRVLWGSRLSLPL